MYLSHTDLKDLDAFFKKNKKLWNIKCDDIDSYCILWSPSLLTAYHTCQSLYDSQLGSFYCEEGSLPKSF